MAQENKGRAMLNLILVPVVFVPCGNGPNRKALVSQCCDRSINTTAASGTARKVEHLSMVGVDLEMSRQLRSNDIKTGCDQAGNGNQHQANFVHVVGFLSNGSRVEAVKLRLMNGGGKIRSHRKLPRWSSMGW